MQSKPGLYGLDSNLDDCSLAIIPVPWEATTSYGAGTSMGPSAILKASPQLDLYTYDQNESVNKNSIFLLDDFSNLKSTNDSNKTKAQKIITHLDTHPNLNDELKKILQEVNSACDEMVNIVYKKSMELLEKNKKVAVLGGDHSSPLGLIKALSEKHKAYDVLHIDAHLDLRNSYQGFKHSHASIMFNVLNLDNPPENLVSVGIRDFCQEEMDLVNSTESLSTFTDENIQNHLFGGSSWQNKVNEIIGKLKNPTYISFDIDGLDPKYCPNTGTPVPGGLTFNQAKHLVEQTSNKTNIIGFDLCEVSPDQSPSNEWDGNVGARILFLLYKSIFK